MAKHAPSFQDLIQTVSSLAASGSPAKDVVTAALASLDRQLRLAGAAVPCGEHQRPQGLVDHVRLDAQGVFRARDAAEGIVMGDGFKVEAR